MLCYLIFIFTILINKINSTVVLGACGYQKLTTNWFSVKMYDNGKIVCNSKKYFLLENPVNFDCNSGYSVQFDTSKSRLFNTTNIDKRGNCSTYYATFRFKTPNTGWANVRMSGTYEVTWEAGNKQNPRYDYWIQPTCYYIDDSSKCVDYGNGCSSC